MFSEDFRGRSHLATTFMSIKIGSIDNNDNELFCLCHQVGTKPLVTMQLISDDTKSSRHCRLV